MQIVSLKDDLNYKNATENAVVILVSQLKSSVKTLDTDKERYRIAKEQMMDLWTDRSKRVESFSLKQSDAVDEKYLGPALKVNKAIPVLCKKYKIESVLHNRAWYHYGGRDNAKPTSCSIANVK